MMEQKLSVLRTLMAKEAIDYYLVPSQDMHMSEYVSPEFQRAQFLSGFTGSNAFVVVSQKPEEGAFLWTDSRYFVQAEQELDPQFWTLKKSGKDEKFVQFMNNKVQNGKKINIGLDATLFSGETMKAYKSALDKANFQFVFPEKNLIDELKTQIKVPEPNFSERLIFVANPQEENDKFGVTRHHSDKLEIIRSAMRQRNSYFLLNSKLDDVAWALNLRGKNFVECCPVFHAFLLISLEKAWFFVNDSFFSKESGKKHSVFEHLKERNENIEILPYETIKSFDFEKNLTIPEKYLTQKINKVWYCEEALNYSLIKKLKKLKKSKETNVAVPFPSNSLITDIKAIKESKEIKGFERAHLVDGIALTRFFSWAEQQIKNSTNLNEYEIGQKNTYFRTLDKNYMFPSFLPIVASGPNGPNVHYRPKEEGSRTAHPDEMILVDSGASYTDGVTDVTRVFYFGNPSKLTDIQREAYTRVLQGVINMNRIVFPGEKMPFFEESQQEKGKEQQENEKGTKYHFNFDQAGIYGSQLDSFARFNLWAAGLDFGHGVGHGVGLNVHEDGIGVSRRANSNIREGHVFSNEPGYYQSANTIEGHENDVFGIRIENLETVVNLTNAKESNEGLNLQKPPKYRGSNGEKYLGLKTLTCVPIQTSPLLKREIMSSEEIAWIEHYNKKCFQILKPFLEKNECEGDAQALKFLERICNSKF